MISQIGQGDDLRDQIRSQIEILNTDLIEDPD